MSESSPNTTNPPTTLASTRPDYSSDSEISSVLSTCTWAKNYKLPARYVYPRNTSNAECNYTSNDTSSSNFASLYLHLILILIHLNVLMMIWKQRIKKKMMMKIKMIMMK